MSRKRLSVEEALRMIQESDSEDDVCIDSFGESSEFEESDVDNIQDPNIETNSDSESESDDSFDLETLPRKRARYTNLLSESQIFESHSGRKWATENNNSAQTLSSNILRETSGLTGSSKDVTNKFDTLKLFITTEIINVIARETNRRAKKITTTWNQEHPAKKKVWQETDETELYAFIGLLLLGGVYKSANESLEEIWSMDSGRPIFRATMSLQRFQNLLRFCRFDNDATRNERLQVDKLAAIRDVWEMFLENLPKYYKPGQDLTVDEQLVATRGRFSFRQYIPSKPGKYGIKIFWCCDSTTSFPLKAEVYVGRKPGAAFGANNVSDIVKRLVQPWKNKGRNITMDNYFTSAQLAEDLLAVKTTVVGTIRKNRKEVPKELLPNRQREEKSSIFCFDKQLTLVSYTPKKGKAVILLSSMHHDKKIIEEKDNKPEIITHYNATKSGVDNFDHLCRLYTCKRKIRRWPMVFWFNILDCAAIAGYVIWILKYSDWESGKRHRRRLFLKDLGRELVNDLIMRRLQNVHAMQSGVRLSIKSLGFEIPKPNAATNVSGNPEPNKKTRCQLCPRSLDRKVKSRCINCHIPCCPEHQKIVCEVCLMNI